MAVDRVGEAKREGRLSIYGTVETHEMEPWIRRFNNLYPFLEVSYRREYVYGTPPPMAEKVREELSSGGESADILLSAISPHLQMLDMGMFARYISPERVNIPEAFRDGEGYWTSILLLPTILAYNSELVNERDLPRNPEELLDGRWKESIALHDPTYGTFGAEWLSSLRSILARERWSRFVEGLASSRPRRFPLFRHIVESVASGESKIGLTVVLYEYLRAMDENRPINRFRISEIPLLTSATAASILSTSRHRASAELFIDFILSREGQEMIGESYIRIPAAQGVDAKYSIEKLVDESVLMFPSGEVMRGSKDDARYYRTVFS